MEVRALEFDAITDEGIAWTAATRRQGQAARRGLIEWSPALREAITEAPAVPRYKHAGKQFVFAT